MTYVANPIDMGCLPVSAHREREKGLRSGEVQRTKRIKGEDKTGVLKIYKFNVFHTSHHIHFTQALQKSIMGR